MRQIDCVRGFDADEFLRRRNALQARMAVAGMDALLLTSAADIFYATGFLTRFWESPARPWFVIVPAYGDLIAVIPSIGAELMGKTWVSDIRTWDAPDPKDDGLGLLTDTLCEYVPRLGCIGVPMGLETQLRMALGDYLALSDRLAPRRIADATDVVQRVREIKSEQEIDKIRTACGIAGRSFARINEIASAGIPLDRVFRDFQRLLLEEGADWVSYTAGGAGQGGYGDVISPAQAVPLVEGDVLMLDTGAVWDGYFCDYDRNFSIGAPTADVVAAHRALFEATEIVMQALRPGLLASDVHRLFCETLEALGQTPGGGRLGHGLGVTLTEWPSFTPKDQTELRAGMVLTLEPGVELAPGRLIVHEENIVLREEGIELLSPRASEMMPVLGEIIS